MLGTNGLDQGRPSLRRRRQRAAALVGIAGLVAALVALSPGRSSAAPQPASGASLPGRAIGHAPAIPVGSVDLGPASSSGTVSFDVVLAPRSATALQAVAQAVSDPKSAAYGHFLTTAQFAARFGAPPATVESVDHALRADGLRPGPVSANGLIVSVSGPIGQVERSLSTGFDSYRLASGRVAMANTAAPRLPASIAGKVQAVIGLNTLATDEVAPPSPKRSSGGSVGAPAATGPTACAAAVTAGQNTGGWTENQLAKAYSFNGLYTKGQLGANTTVALFELDPYAASDIAAFQSCYKTSVPITKVNVDGGDGTGVGEGEATLDIETVIGLAPKAKLRVYEAPGSNYAKSTIDEYSRIISDNAAQIISSSYGLCEPVVNALFPGLAASENSLFQEAATQGISTFVASGDTGSSECYPNGGVEAISLASGSDPAAVGVDPSFHTAYVADYGTGTLSVVDDVNEDLITTVPLGSGSNPGSVSVDTTTHKVFVGLSGSNQLAEVSSATCNATKTTNCTVSDLTVGTSANDVEGVAANPATGTVYVALESENRVAAVKETGLTLIHKILSNGTEPYGIAVNRATNQVYVTNFGSNTVARIDGATCDAASSSGCSQTPPVTSVGSGPASVTVDNGAGQFFVVGFNDNSLSVLSTTTGALLDEFDLSSVVTEPVDVTLSPDGQHLLIPANFAGLDSVEAGILVVHITTTPADDTITGILDDVGQEPFAVASDPTTDVVTEADPADGAAIFLPLGLAVDDPSSQPWATSVGGTDLTALGPKPTETTWNEFFNSACGCQEGAGTGGISINWPMPSWQSGPGVVSSHSSGVPCGATSGDCREVPDVSASADPVNGYVIFHNGSWTSIGGTSAATPLWAALFAVIESKDATPVRQGFLNPRLYTTAAAHRAATFNDVKTGTNDYVGIHNGLYPATTVYDMATGLGSPIGTGLQTNLPAP